MAEQWGVWRSDGEWVLQRGTRAPWVAKNKSDAQDTAKEMTHFAAETGAPELVYEARALPASA